MTYHSNRAIDFIELAIYHLTLEMLAVPRDKDYHALTEEGHDALVRYQRAIWKMEFAMDNIKGISKD